jgi:glycosyltransferase involved in cell wall biosynthesis
LPAPLRAGARLAVRVAESWAQRRVRLLLAEESYQGRFSRPHPVVPNSVLVPAAEPAPPAPDRAVYLGRLTVARGALDLIEVGRRLAGQVRMELYGPADGDCAAQLSAADQAGWVRYHGFVPNSVAVGAMSGAVAGLSLLHDQPNYAHSRPTKIMEYMAAGVPVVSTPNPASVELLERYECGLLVPFGDPAAASEAILGLRSDPELRSRLAAHGRAAAVRELDWRLAAVPFTSQLRTWAAQRRGSVG